MSADLKELLHALGDPSMPTAVWQAQFDGEDAALKRLAYARPGEPVRMQDLLSYCDDLRYVEELQEGLLLRALPHALHAWRMQGVKRGANALDETLWAALARRREFIAQVLGPDGTRAATRFMAQGLLERMAHEDSLQHRGTGASPYLWSRGFISFGCAWDDAEMILSPWRAMAKPGLALCAVQYLASLVYDGDDNPVFSAWTKGEGGGPIIPWENASIGFDENWSEESVERLRARLAGGAAAGWLAEAAARLEDHPHRALAEKVAADAASRRPRLESRAADLCRFLAAPSQPALLGWSA